MNATDFPCGCCGEDKPEISSVYDGGLERTVCEECAGDLMNAADALAGEGIPPIHRGPYCGNSNG